MHLGLLGLSLVCIAAATPVTLNGLSSEAHTLSASNKTFLDVEVSTPWIPKDFKILRTRPYEAFHGGDCFMFALNLIGQQALQNFNGSLTAPNITFRDPDYPDMELIVTSYESDRPLSRQFFLWGMAKIMAFMEVTVQFSAHWFLLEWKETRVGLIRWVHVNTSDSSIRGSNTIPVPLTESRQPKRTAAIALGDHQLSWAYDFHGTLLTLTEVFMSTIAALIQAAELGNYTVDSFTGYWPPADYWPFRGYPVKHHWVTRVRPSVFTKDILIKSILAATKFAQQQTNYHEVDVFVTDKHELIARGGYNKTTLPSPLSVSDA